MNILVVDDQRSVRTMLRNELRQLGLKRISEADDGAAALHAMVYERFDLVITELNMPGLDGLGMLRAMRKNPKTAGIPVVLLAGAAAGDAITEAAKLGVDAIIVKPFTMGGFAKRISMILANPAQPKAGASATAAIPDPPHARSQSPEPIFEID